MAIESPLFQSSMELLGHSILHFNRAEELDRKLVILHLTNAIELILKDILLDRGESIYKNPKETITIHGCLQALKNKSIQIPYLNKIELLIDERNALQHRFGSPNELTTIFYMNIAIDFFKEILESHYGQDYEEIIAQFADEKELIAFQMHEPRDDAELENLKKLAKLHPLGALLSAMTYLEKTIIQFTEKIGLDKELRRRPIWHMMSHRILMRYGINIPEELSEKLESARRLRNLVAHGRKEPTIKDVEDAIEAIEEFERFVSNIDVDAARKSIEITLHEREEELRKRRIAIIKEKEANNGVHTDA